ncbi:hypothetical protein AB1Y20_013963 [Prymnesium parvum]|uniref:Uncharacterized protein n=1 Tax=Prymnesium parvum TaxID=97485 RepID=A0AB34IH85_PRYPA
MLLLGGDLGLGNDVLRPFLLDGSAPGERQRLSRVILGQFQRREHQLLVLARLKVVPQPRLVSLVRAPRGRFLSRRLGRRLDDQQAPAMATGRGSGEGEQAGRFGTG